MLSGLGGNDGIFGAGGADVIIGGIGADVLGGSLNTAGPADGVRDTFRYTAPAHSTPTANDTIIGFEFADRIDVANIDANTDVAGNQAFRFDDGGSFSAGEIRLSGAGGDPSIPNSFGTWALFFNTDADAAAEMLIILQFTQPTFAPSADTFLF